jgi:hypothetical protein
MIEAGFPAYHPNGLQSIQSVGLLINKRRSNAEFIKHRKTFSVFKNSYG